MVTIVIDIGGTNFRIGIFTDTKKIIDAQRFETPNFINHPHLTIDKLQELLITTLVNRINIYKKRYKNINSVGLSFPAAITSEDITHKVPTVWGKLGANYPLRDRLNSKMPNMKLVIANDITAAAERYGQIGKYKSVDYLGIITVSSGIGNKVYDVRNRKVILDKLSIGGELGHIQYKVSKNAIQCECGGHGHIASFSSGRAVEKTTQTIAKKFPEKFKKSLLGKLCRKPENITNYKIVEAAKQGDKFTLKILDKTTFPLAYAMGYLSGTIGVGKFIFIGGFALNLGEVYLDSLKRNLRKIEFFSRKSTEINDLVELGINDDNDCLIGIGLLAQK